MTTTATSGTSSSSSSTAFGNHFTPIMDELPSQTDWDWNTSTALTTTTLSLQDAETNAVAVADADTTANTNEDTMLQQQQQHHYNPTSMASSLPLSVFSGDTVIASNTELPLAEGDGNSNGNMTGMMLVPFFGEEDPGNDLENLLLSSAFFSADPYSVSDNHPNGTTRSTSTALSMGTPQDATAVAASAGGALATTTSSMNEATDNTEENDTTLRLLRRPPSPFVENSEETDDLLLSFSAVFASDDVAESTGTSFPGDGEEKNNRRGMGGCIRLSDRSTKNNKRAVSTLSMETHCATVAGSLAKKQRVRTATATWERTPIPVLLCILKFLNQNGLMNASCISKQFHDIIHRHLGMQHHRITPVLQISAASNNPDNEGRLLRLMIFFKKFIDRLQHYRVLKLIDVEKFTEYVELTIQEAFYQNLHLDGIVSLDISSPYKLSNVHGCVLEYVSSMLPNLRELDMSNVGGNYFDESVLESFSRNCPKLERITWNNIDINCLVCLDGSNIDLSTNLTEIIMDGSTFCGTNEYDPDNDLDKLSDLENNSDVFLFCRCKSQVLERLSIRGAIYNGGYGCENEIVPQNALIKYIRRAPRALRWFRSDLSKENIEMLRLERPDIELLN